MKFMTTFILGLIVALLTSCGGGGSLIAEGGIGGTGIVMGRVSGFGSLYVNGVKFDVSNSDFVYEEETAATPGDASGIQVGMVVRIIGTDDGVTGLADIVEYTSLLEGTISSNTIASNGTGTLVAMGQTISVDADTVYDDGGLAIALSALPLGAIIEVSGFTDGGGNILATRIEAKALGYGGETLDVKGLVSALDTTAKSFMLGTLGIDYTRVVLPSDVTDGIYVEAKGTLQNDNLVAEQDIQIEGDGDLVIAENGEEAELEGIVTDILSTTLFTVNGQQVLVDGATEFLTVSAAANLTIGQPLEVSGVMDGITLVASKIELKPSAGEKEELEAVLQALDPIANSITLLGQTIRVTSSTIFENDLSDEQAFNLSNLTAGTDYVSVDLYMAADGVLEATKLEWESNPSQDPSYAEIEGFIQATVDANPLTITLVGVTVDISDPALSGFTPIEGDRIEITGVYDADSGILLATSIDVEDD